MAIVAHFIRRFLPYSATFIQNQILYHKDFKPVIVFRENIANGLNMNDWIDPFPQFDLSNKQNLFECLSYKWFRYISSQQIKSIDDFLNNCKPDILHFHFGSDAGMFYEVMKNCKIPSVVSFYGYDCSSFPDWYFGYGKHFLKNRVFPYATKIIAMSKDMKNDLLRIGCPEEKIEIHYYGSEIDRFCFPERLYVKKEKMTFLTVGRLDEKKGFLFTLEALNRIKQKNILNFEWRIVGSGPLFSELQKQIIKYRLENNVKFIGKLDYFTKDLINEFKEADIYIQPNVIGKKGDKEGISGSIVEAMASGLPVISSYHAGIPEIIENEISGFLVKEWDIDTLVNRIQQLAFDVNLREKLGKSAQLFATQNLNIRLKISDREKIYSSCVESVV